MITRLPSAEEIDDIARIAVAHRRSVERRLLGLPVRGAVGSRIDAELAKRGWRPPTTTPNGDAEE